MSAVISKKLKCEKMILSVTIKSNDNFHNVHICLKWPETYDVHLTLLK